MRSFPILRWLLVDLAVIAGFTFVVNASDRVSEDRQISQVLVEACEHVGGATVHEVAGQYLWCERDGKPTTLSHEEVYLRLLSEGLIEIEEKP